MNSEHQTPIEELAAKGIVSQDTAKKSLKIEKRISGKQEGMREARYENLGKAFLYIDMLQTVIDVAKQEYDQDTRTDDEKQAEPRLYSSKLHDIVFALAGARESMEKQGLGDYASPGMYLALRDVVSILGEMYTEYEKTPEESPLTPEQAQHINELLSRYEGAL